MGEGNWSSRFEPKQRKASKGRSCEVVYTHLILNSPSPFRSKSPSASSSLFKSILNIIISWGMPFLEETFLYHLIRSDHRHNFSPYFLPIYLSSTTTSNISQNFLNTPLPQLFSSIAKHLPTFTPTSPDPSSPTSNELQIFLESLISLILSSTHELSNSMSKVTLEPLLSFLPQFLLTGYLGYKIGKKDLVMAFGLQTLAFVGWNKVCTSQVSVASGEDEDNRKWKGEMSI